MQIKAAVLCGGLGKRLRPLTYYFQKVMIPIGRKQKPLLEYIVKLLKYHGVTNIVLLVGYKYEQIINYFEDGKRFGVNIEYAVDEPNLGGTGGALLNAFRKGLFNDVENILVYYGDILSNINIKDLINYHDKMDSDATLAIASKYQVPVGIVEVDEHGKVIEMREKPWIPLKVTIGILVLRAKTLEVLDEINKKYKLNKIDIMKDFIPELIERNYRVYAYNFNGEWYDVGSTERYEKLDNAIIDSMFKDII